MRTSQTTDAEMAAATEPTSTPNRPRNPWMWIALGGVVLGWLHFYADLTFHWRNAEYYNYGWTIAPLALVLGWLRRRELPRKLWEKTEAGPQRTLLWVALLLAMGVVLTDICMEVDRNWRLMLWLEGGLLAMASLGLIAALGGFRLAGHFAFPLLFLLAAIPWPTFLEQSLVIHLTGLVSRVSVETLRLGGFPAHLYGHMIFVEGVPMEIDAACSGIRSFQSVIMAALFLGEVFRTPWGWRIFLIVAGIATAVFFNILRSCVLCWIAFANAENPDVFHAWHDILGYLALILTLASLYLLTLRLPSVITERRVKTEPPQNPTIARPAGASAPALLTVTACLLAGAPLLAEGWFGLHQQFRRAPQSIPWTFNLARAGAEYNLQLLDVVRREHVPQNIDYGVQAWGVTADQARRLEISHFLWRDGEVGLHKALGHRPEYCVGVYLGADMLREPEMFSLEVLQDKDEPVTLLVEQQLYRTPADGRVVHIFRTVWQNGSIDIQSKRTHWGRLQDALQGRRSFRDPTQHLFLAMLSPESAESARQFAARFFQDTLEPASAARIEFLLNRGPVSS